MASGIRHRDQLSFEDFFLPFGGQLSGDNRWIKPTPLIPRDDREDDCAAQCCKGFGAPAKPFRILDDQRQRNGVEGRIGRGKRRYGFGLIRVSACNTEMAGMNDQLATASGSSCLLDAIPKAAHNSASNAAPMRRALAMTVNPGLTDGQLGSTLASAIQRLATP